MADGRPALILAADQLARLDASDPAAVEAVRGTVGGLLNGSGESTRENVRRTAVDQRVLYGESRAEAASAVAAALGEPEGQRALFRSLAELLSDASALRPPQVVIPRLAWAGRTTLLAAREKAGKSTLASAAAAAVSRGGPWLGDPTHGGKVLWVGLEEHVGDLSLRFRDWGAAPAAVFVVDGLAAAGAPLVALRAAAIELQPALVVVDTLAALAAHLSERPEPGSSADWTPVMAGLTRIARDTDAACLLLHHARKSDGGYRDSTAIGAGVDAIVLMSEDGQDADVRALKVRARWPVSDYSVRLLADPRSSDPDRYALSSGEVSLDTRVLLRVEAHPGCSMRQLREGVTGRTQDVTATVHRLIERGVIEDRRSSGGGMALYPAEKPTGTAKDPPLPEGADAGQAAARHPGNRSGNRPGSGEKATGTATEPPSGTAPVPLPEPIGAASGTAPLFEGDFRCSAGCGASVGRAGIRCARCTATAATGGAREAAS